LRELGEEKRSEKREFERENRAHLFNGGCKLVWSIFRGGFVC